MQIRAKVNEMLQCGTVETDEAFGAPTESLPFPDIELSANNYNLHTLFIAKNILTLMIK